MVLTIILMFGSIVEYIRVSWSLEEPLLTKSVLYFAGLAYIYFGFFHLYLLRPLSVWWAFLVITATWVYDTAAYGFGIWLGKHKIAPKISPGKSWEGTIGGIVTAVLYLALLSYFNWLSLPHSLVLGLLIGVAALLGDLIESRFKRYANIKDTGRIIPGHGGFLDRFDSLMLVSVISFWFLKSVVAK